MYCLPVTAPPTGNQNNMLYKKILCSNDQEEFASRVFDEIYKYISDNKLIKNLNFSENVDKHIKNLEKERSELLLFLESYKKLNDFYYTLKEEIHLLEANKIRYQRYISNSIFFDFISS